MNLPVKVLVIGASGLVGTALMKEGQRLGIETIGTSFGQDQSGLVKCDIRNKEEIEKLMDKIRPEWVLLTAANPNVDYCEAHPEETAEINVHGVRKVAEVCNEFGSKLVFFSSDYVFDGESGPYREEDTPNPINEYGKQKLAGEKLVAEILPDAHLILRITVVYGIEAQGKNFVARLVRSLREGHPVRVPVDQVGSPTYSEDLAQATFELISKDASGVYHVAGGCLQNRYEFACTVAEVFGLDQSLIETVSTLELNQIAPRPLRAGLTSEKMCEVIGRSTISSVNGLGQLKALFPESIQ